MKDMKEKIRKAMSFIRRNKVTTKVISCVLSLVLVFYVIPSSIYAEAAELMSENGDNEVVAEGNVFQQSSHVYEIEELRESNAKHFRTEDGSYVLAQYNYDVHYLNEEGEWVDYDNTISETLLSGYATPDSNIKFSKKLNGSGNVLTFKNDNLKISISALDVNKTNAEVINNEDADELTELQKLMNLEKLSSRVVYADAWENTDLEYVLIGEKIKENIIVKDKRESYIYSFELKLKGLSASLEDNGDIHLKNSKSGELEYTIPAPIVYDAYGEMPDKSEAYYELSGKNNTYTLTVTVSAEWMNSELVTYPVTIDPTFLTPGDANIYDASTGTYWDDNSPLLYVKLDEPVFWKADLAKLPNYAQITKATLILPYHSSAGKFTPDLMIRGINGYPENQPLSKETMSYMYPCARSPIYYGYMRYSFDITNLVKYWNEDPLRNKGALIEYVDPTQFHELNITTRLYASENEYLTNSIYPRMEINYVGTSGIEGQYSYSSQNAGIAGVGSVNHFTGALTWQIPTITTSAPLMSYTPTLVYNTYLAKQHYVNDYANTAYTSAFLPVGFKLNICETIIKRAYIHNGTQKYQYIYEDGDGTPHTFVESEVENVYVDDCNSSRKLTISEYNIIMTDDSNITKLFAKRDFTNDSTTVTAWYLLSITDAYGNRLGVTIYTNGSPYEIKLTPAGQTQSISLLKFLYDTSGMLIAVYNPTTMDAVVLRYSSTYSGDISTSDCKYLRQVDFVLADDTGTSVSNIQSFYNTGVDSGLTNTSSAEYGYNRLGQLTYASDTNRSIQFDYETNKVVSVTETGSDSTVGQNLAIEYHSNYTDVTSSGNDDIINTDDDVITRYAFDDVGRTVSIYSFSEDNSTIYSATSGVYSENENAKNNLKQQIAIGGVNVNYILNGSFEERTADGKFLHWIESHDNYISGTSSNHILHNYDDEGYTAARLNPQSGNTATLSQRVFLPAGEYTLSMCYRSGEAAGYLAGARISSLSDSGLLHSESITLTDDNVTGMNSVFSTTFTVPDHLNGGDNVEVSFWITDPVETVNSSFGFSIDRVMLTRNVGAEEFSIVDYGSFDANHITDTGSITDIGSKWLWGENGDDEVNVADAEAPFGKVAKVEESIGVVKQRIYEIPPEQLAYYGSQDFVSNAGFNYIVSGFAKAENAVASTDTSVFRIRVQVTYYHGEDLEDHTEDFIINLLDDCDGWQFVTGSFSTQHLARGDDFTYACIKSIDVFCEYYGQTVDSYALFDNISVIQCTENNMVEYDYYIAEDGENLAGLLSIKSTLKYKEYYEYDANRNLTRVANTLGDIVDYEYYSNNVIKSVTSKRFTYNGTYSYPFGEADIDSIITPITLSSTEYTYDEYGLNTAITVRSNENDSGKTMVTEYEYNTTAGSHLFGILNTEYDINGNEIRHYYDTRGRLLSKINAHGGAGICYIYDSEGRLDYIKPAVANSDTGYTPISNAEYVDYSYFDSDRISDIDTATTNYTFTYDNFGNTLSISAGNNVLASYEYNDYNGKLKKITYGNGFIVEYVYNDLEILSQIWYTEGETRYMAYKYEYNADGSLYREVDCISGKSVIYKYDTLNRIVAINESFDDESYYSFDSTREYNDQRQLSRIMYHLNYEAPDEEYTEYITHMFYYHSTYKYLNYELTGSYNGGEMGIDYFYDELDRISSVEKGAGEFSHTLDYTYKDYGTNCTTPLVETVTSTVNEEVVEQCTYTYDSLGNITRITFQNGDYIGYSYDDIGQLIKENHPYVNTSYIYQYDNAGNIIKVTRTQVRENSGGGEVIIKSIGGESDVSLNLLNPTLPDVITTTVDYTYSDSEWGDLLTSYDGQAITYDEIGNPLSYYNGLSFTWEGRRLIGATNGTDTYSFTYNVGGLRTSKTVNGVTTNYIYDGTLLVAEQSDLATIIYIYDANGSPVGFQYRESTYPEKTFDTYWYEKNVFGDIVGVYNDAGAKLVTYNYDAWGNFTAGYRNGGANTSVVNNPFRYRGYYYDSDLEFYYLQSRYYDSNTRRFINTDGYVSTGQGLTGYNMFAYCGNNPVMRVDPNGEGWILAIVLVGILVLSLTSCSSNEITEDDINLYSDTEGSRQEGKINVKFSPNGTDDEGNPNPSFQIENSYKITNSKDQEFILNYIVESEFYSQEVYCRTMDSMLIEWDAHNDIHSWTHHERVKHTDFDKKDEDMEYWDYWEKGFSEWKN